jgi:predicted DNA-binding antitoxin AbrB/MazE fold protein
MTITVDATYENGVLKPSQPVTLPEGAQVRLSIQLPAELHDPLADVIGIVDGPESGDAASNHDAYLYGRRTG